MSLERDRSPVDRRNRRVGVGGDDRAERNVDCKLFVSNFPFEARWQELKDLFRAEVGNVVEVEVFNDENGKSRGCGLVEFTSSEAAREALRKMDRYEWKGRKLTIKKASDRERDEFGRLVGIKSRGGGGGRSGPECRVYVSNLPYEMKWQDVKDLFRDNVGESSYVELFNDEKGKPRGCGILEFNSEEMAQKAIRKLNKHEIKGRKILVQEALDHERDKYGYIIKGGSRGRSDRRDRSPDRRRSRDRDRSPPSAKSPSSKNFGYTYGLSVEFLESLGIDGPLQYRVFVANLAFSVDEDKLREVFRLAGRLVSVEVTKDRDGKSRGYGLVEFTHPVEAVQAISMFNNHKLYDRAMHVRFDRDSSPEETRLPNRLPEGLESIGMGLGSGGKPLTDVLKSLQQLGETEKQQQQDPAAGIAPTVKTLAELTPALALLAQQMSAAANQAPNLNAMGQAGVFGQALNPGANLLGSGFNAAMNVPVQQQQPLQNQMQVLQQQQQQQQQRVGAGYTTAMGSQQAGYGGGGFGSAGGMGQNANVGPGMGSMGGVGPANTSGYPIRSAQPSAVDRSRPSPNLSRNAGMQLGRQDNGSARYSPGPVPAPYGETHRGLDGPNSRQVWDTVIVRNLPADLDWQELREFFETCGEVKNAMIKERGVGLVRFANERSAENAINFDNTMKWGRLLDVRIF